MLIRYLITVSDYCHNSTNPAKDFTSMSIFVKPNQYPVKAIIFI